MNADVKYKIMGAAAKGNVALLQQLLDDDRCLTTSFMHMIVYTAAEYGRISVLEWVTSNSKGISHYAKRAITLAKRNGHVEVVNWFRNGDTSDDVF